MTKSLILMKMCDIRKFFPITEVFSQNVSCPKYIMENADVSLILMITNDMWKIIRKTMIMRSLVVVNPYQSNEKKKFLIEILYFDKI